MENLSKYKSHIKDVQELVEKLENGTLGLDELVKLEELTRNLHERSVILKYKAFEEQAIPKSIDIDMIDEIEEEELETPEEEQEIDFSMFGEGPMDEISEEITEDNTDVTEVTEPEPEPQSNPEPEMVEVKVENETELVEEETTKQDQEFWERIQSEEHSLSSQFEESKLETLVGAFSLNEKLRFINELFDGSSELFSEAIKVLDAFDSINQASGCFSEFATEYNWDPEDEAVVEFMTFVRRRYA